MRKLSEIRGEEAIEVLSEVVEPLVAIISDADVQEVVREKKPFVLAVKPALKSHKKEVLHILAAIEGIPDEEYAPSIIELPAMLIGLLNDPEIQTIVNSLFTSGSKDSASSMSPSESTEA